MHGHPELGERLSNLGSQRQAQRDEVAPVEL